MTEIDILTPASVATVAAALAAGARWWATRLEKFFTDQIVEQKQLNERMLQQMERQHSHSERLIEALTVIDVRLTRMEYQLGDLPQRRVTDPALRRPGTAPLVMPEGAD